MEIIKKILRGLNIFSTNVFGSFMVIKRFLIALIGILSYSRMNLVNHLHIEGTEHLENLPERNVIFLSNHQTYFADVIAFYHIFCSVKWGFKNSINNPIYLLMPRVRMFFIAAEETMKSGFLPKLFAYAGAVTVKRTWRSEGQNVDRNLDMDGTEKIKQALSDGWLVSFPQGTTSPFAPIRKGTAHIIKNYQPIVVPVIINGFRRAFDKKGLFFRKKGTVMTVKFKEAILFDFNAPVEDILEIVKKSLEQEVVLTDVKKFKGLKWK